MEKEKAIVILPDGTMLSTRSYLFVDVEGESVSVSGKGREILGGIGMLLGSELCHMVQVGMNKEQAVKMIREVFEATLETFTDNVNEKGHIKT